MPDSRGLEFFPFHPVRLRLGIALASIACAAITASSVAQARSAREPFAWARAGICFALMIGFGWLFIRLRPKAGWGVTVGPLGLTISRPLAGEMLLAWSQVSIAKREGQKKLGIFANDGSVVWIDANMFPSRAVFNAMTEAVASRVEPRRLDS